MRWYEEVRPLEDLGSEAGALMNRISALIKVTLECPLALSHMRLQREDHHL